MVARAGAAARDRGRGRRRRRSVAGSCCVTLCVTLAKVVAFVAVMLLVGRRVIPWVIALRRRAPARASFSAWPSTPSRSASPSARRSCSTPPSRSAPSSPAWCSAKRELSQRATEEAMPLRDAFAVLFFVSVGMLFNPAVLVDAPLRGAGHRGGHRRSGSRTPLFADRARLRAPVGTALTVSASLAQIGEFSFILVGLGMTLGMLPEEGRDLVLAGAILSILLNPSCSRSSSGGRARAASGPRRPRPPAAPQPAEPLRRLSSRWAPAAGRQLGVLLRRATTWSWDTARSARWSGRG